MILRSQSICLKIAVFWTFAWAVMERHLSFVWCSLEVNYFIWTSSKQTLSLGCYEMLSSILLFFVLAIPSLILILTLVHTRCCVIFCSSQLTVLQRHWSDCIDRICLLVCFFIMLSTCICMLVVTSLHYHWNIKHHCCVLLAVQFCQQSRFIDHWTGLQAFSYNTFLSVIVMASYVWTIHTLYLCVFCVLLCKPL